MKKITFIIAMFFMLTVLSVTALAEVDTEYDKGLEYYNKGKFEEAVKYFKEYVQKKPDAETYYRIGYALYKLGKHDEAFKYFDDAYLINPEFSPMPLGERPVEETQPEEPKILGVTTEEPRVLGVTTEEPVIQKQEIILKEQLVEEIQLEVPQVLAVTPEEPVAQKEEIIPEEKTQPKMRFEPPPGFPSEEPVPFEAPKIPIALMALMAGLGIFMLVIAILFYIYYCLCLFYIAKKLDVPDAWIAWIPIANLWTVVRSAGKPWWWMLVALIGLIPYVGIIVVIPGIYLWMCITENLGRNKWSALLLLLPIVNFIFLGMLAFSKREVEAAPTAAEPSDML